MNEHEKAVALLTNNPTGKGSKVYAENFEASVSVTLRRCCRAGRRLGVGARADPAGTQGQDRGSAREVVVDPTHIGVAVENTASSLEEMITMIEEMFSLNGKLDDLYGLAEKVSEVADRFKEVGYLVDMTETYNELLQRTYDYSSRIKEWAAEGDIYNYERELRYIYRCETQGIKLFEQYMNYFRSLKTTDADKAEKAEKTIEKMEKALEELTRTMDAAEQSRQIGESLADAATFLDRGLSVDDYTQTYRSLGDAESDARTGGGYSLFAWK